MPAFVCRRRRSRTISVPVLRMVLTCALSLAALPVNASTVALGERECSLAAGSVYLLREPVTLEEAQKSSHWSLIPETDLDLGFSNDIFWFRTEITAAEPRRAVLIADASITGLTAFVVEPGNAARVREIPLDLKTRMLDSGIHYRRPAFEVNFLPGTTTVFFRLQSQHLIRFPLRVCPVDAFHEFRSEEMFAFGIFFGTLAAIALYNFFVFLSTKEKSYLVYIVYLLATIGYNLIFEGFHIQWSNIPPEVAVRAPVFFGGLIGIAANMFARDFLNTRTHVPPFDKIHVLLIVAGVAFAVSAFITAIPFGWIARAAGVAAGVTAITMASSGILAWRAGFRPARYYTLAIGFFAVGTFVYALRILSLIGHSFIVQHSGQIGVTIEMLLFSLALSDRINSLKRSLERHLSDLKDAHQTIVTSEQKYRALVEGTSDMIFSTDTGGTILSVSHASRGLIGFTPEALAGRSLFDLVYESAGDSQSYAQLILRDQFQDANIRIVQHRVRFATRTGEPVEVDVRLEKLQGSDGLVIGKASRPTEDVLVKSIESETGRYAIENFLTTADLLNDRISRSLARYFHDDQVQESRIVLREMLVNAIEHGNLEVSYDEKTKAQSEGNYLNLIRTRQSQVPYRGRRVSVAFSMNHLRIWIRIADEGPGFDHHAMKLGEEARMKSLSESHGRGIGLARMLFDIVRYNEKGNVVTLVKWVKKKS